MRKAFELRQKKDDGSYFDEFFKDLDELDDLADQLNADNRIERIWELSCVLNSTLDIQILLERIMEEAIRLSAAERGFLLLKDENEELSARVAHKMSNQEMQDVREEISQTIVKQVMKLNEPLIVDNAGLDNHFAQQQSVLNLKLKSILCVPLESLNRQIGVIYLDHRGKPGAFTEKEKRLLRTFANFAALVIQKARLYESLKKSEKKYRMLFESATEAILILELNGAVRDMNETAAKMTGYEKHELQARNIKELAEPGHEEIIEEFLKANPEEKAVFTECRMLNKNKDLLDVEITSRTVTWDQGTFIQAFIRDVTEKKQLENQLLHSHKMEGLGTLAGGLAHDFKNYLSAVLNASSAIRTELEKKHAADEGICEKIAVIENSTGKAAGLAKRLLNFARGEEPTEMKEIQVCVFIDEIIPLVRSNISSDIEFDVNINNEIPPVRGNAEQLQQVILNICLNARDAMPSGGKLSISTSVKEGESIPVQMSRGQRERNYVKLTVADTGEGIEDSILNKIFDPFFTTKDRDKGTGLGLAMVYRLVKNHKGFLEVDSEKGKGTSFSILLPSVTHVEKQEEESDKMTERDENHEQESEVSDRKAQSILIVEDEEIIRELLCSVLEQNNFKSLPAEDGSQARRVLEENGSDLLAALIDITLPDMNGAELYQEIKQINENIPIVFTSGYSWNELSEDVRALDAAGYLEKPFRPEDLINFMNGLL